MTLEQKINEEVEENLYIPNNCDPNDCASNGSCFQCLTEIEHVCTFKRSPCDCGAEKDYLERKEAIRKALKSIATFVSEELKLEKKTDPNNLAGNPGEWECSIAGFNTALTEIDNKRTTLGL